MSDKAIGLLYVASGNRYHVATPADLAAAGYVPEDALIQEAAKRALVKADLIAAERELEAMREEWDSLLGLEQFERKWGHPDSPARVFLAQLDALRTPPRPAEKAAGEPAGTEHHEAICTRGCCCLKCNQHCDCGARKNAHHDVACNLRKPCAVQPAPAQSPPSATGGEKQLRCTCSPGPTRAGQVHADWCLLRAHIYDPAPAQPKPESLPGGKAWVPCGTCRGTGYADRMRRTMDDPTAIRCGRCAGRGAHPPPERTGLPGGKGPVEAFRAELVAALRDLINSRSNTSRIDCHDILTIADALDQQGSGGTG